MKAIYVRTSVDDNDGAAQLHELQTWAEREGWRDFRTFIDRGESGLKASRPAWNEVMKGVTSGKIKELAVTELSRIGRSVVNVILALDDAHRAGCRVVLLRQGLDYSSPVGRAVAAILAAVAQLEREQIVARVRAGVRRAREKGTRSGKPIGRPRTEVTEGQVQQALWVRSYGGSWAEAERLTGVKATTLRRAILATTLSRAAGMRACQKGGENVGREQAEFPGT